MNRAGSIHLQTRQERLLARGEWEPPQRVLLIAASHRGKRGATHMVGAALARGMELAGAQVKTVILAELNFAACRGCFSCWVSGDPTCRQRDDLTPLIEAVPSFDLMLWAMPLYVDGMPGLLKNLLDRMMVLNHPAILDCGERSIHPSRHPAMPMLAVAATCGFWGRENFAPLKAHMLAVARDQHTPLLAFLERPDSLGLMLSEGRKAMAGVEADLEKAGRQIIENGSVAPELVESIARPLLPRDRYLELGENWWKGRK